MSFLVSPYASVCSNRFFSSHLQMSYSLPCPSLVLLEMFLFVSAHWSSLDIALSHNLHFGWQFLFPGFLLLFLFFLWLKRIFHLNGIIRNSTELSFAVSLFFHRMAAGCNSATIIWSAEFLLRIFSFFYMDMPPSWSGPWAKSSTGHAVTLLKWWHFPPTGKYLWGCRITLPSVDGCFLL